MNLGDITVSLDTDGRYSSLSIRTYNAANDELVDSPVEWAVIAELRPDLLNALRLARHGLKAGGSVVIPAIREAAA